MNKIILDTQKQQLHEIKEKILIPLRDMTIIHLNNSNQNNNYEDDIKKRITIFFKSSITFTTISTNPSLTKDINKMLKMCEEKTEIEKLTKEMMDNNNDYLLINQNSNRLITLVDNFIHYIDEE